MNLNAHISNFIDRAKQSKGDRTRELFSFLLFTDSNNEANSASVCHHVSSPAVKNNVMGFFGPVSWSFTLSLLPHFLP